MARDVSNRGGVWGGIPPAFMRTTITSKSPSEAVFITKIITEQADRGFAAQVAGQCCCLGLLGLLCCDHDDHVVCFRTTATGVQCLFM